MESGIKDNLSCGVCNHGLQNPKFSSKKSESRQRWVSGILIQLTWSPQSIVWNPEFKAWIPESKGAFHSTQNPEILVGTSNGADLFILVRPECSEPALKVVHFDRSSHFDRSYRNVPFRLTKLLSQVSIFCILLTRTMTKPPVAWVWSVQPECIVSLGTWKFRKFKPEL